MKFIILLALMICTNVWAKWTVSTYNIRNFDQDSSGPTDYPELERLIQSSKSDVMAFEEVVNVEAFKVLIRSALPGYGIRLSSCGGYGKQHLAVVYNPRSFKFVEQSEDLTFSGPQNSCGSLRPVLFVTLAHSSSKEKFVFGVVHLKAGGDARAFSKRWKQYGLLGGAAKKYEEQNLILLGDFNTTGYNIKNEDFKKFESFMKRSKLSTMSKDIGCSSYWNGGQERGDYQPSLLDHIVLQDSWVSEVEGVKVGGHCAEQECRPASPEVMGPGFENVSDHCPVQVTFK